MTAIRTLLLAAFAACALFAQRDLGTITGTVTDPLGAAVPNAKIIITGEETGIGYDAATDGSGSYIRSMLPAGSYSVTAEAPGFKKKTRRNIAVGLGARVGIDMALEIGALTDSIEVTAAPPPMQTESAVTGGTFQSRSVRDLPLGGNVVSLALLSSGVAPGEPGSSNGFSANGVVSNGQNNFLLNGVDNNSNLIDYSSGAPYVVGPSLEAIGEVRVMTNGFNAEYGRGAGGVMDVSIKSGTNQLHGALFGRLQSDKLDANNWFSNRFGQARPPFSDKLFGIAAGGPLVRNKTFWFADYQGDRSSSRSPQTFTLPYPEFRTGNFSRLLTGGIASSDWLGNPIPGGAIYDYLSTQIVDAGDGNFLPIRQPYPGNIIPASQLDPVALKIAALLPDPNQNLNFNIPSNNYFGVGRGTGSTNQGDVRIDHQFSPKDTLFGSASFSHTGTVNLSALPEELCRCSPYFDAGAMNAMVSWAHIWSPSVFSETRLAFTRLAAQRLQGAFSQDLYKKFGIGGYNPYDALHGGLPDLQLDNYSYLGSNAMAPTLEWSNVWDFVENLALQRGSNSLKFGFEARRIDFPFQYSSEPEGAFAFPRVQTSNFADLANTGDGFASFLQGIPYAGRITTSNMVSDRRLSFSGYVQDDWKATRKLSFNLGVRYDLFSPIREIHGQQANFVPDTLSLLIPAGNKQNAALPSNFPPFINVDRGNVSGYLYPWQKANIGPRFGLAWQPAGRTVIRASYGIFYGGEENESGLPNRGQNVPFNTDVVLMPPNPFVPADGLTTLSGGFQPDVLTGPSMVLLRSVQTNLLPAMSQKWSVAVQRELGWNTSLDVSYIGGHGGHLLTVWDINQPRNAADPTAPTAPRRLIPGIDGPIVNTSSFGRSNYNGLAVKAEKRYSDGLDFLASYTWSHALTDVVPPMSMSPGQNIPRDVTNFGADYANAPFDLRHRFVFSTVYDLPFGAGRLFGKNWRRTATALLGGWQLNAIVTLQTGQPFTLNTRNASCGCGGILLPGLAAGANPNAVPPGGRTVDHWFDPASFTAPAPGTYGNLGMQSNYGPGVANIDVSMFKTFAITERYRLQFRAEADNFTNSPHFGFPNNTQGDPGFGQITSSWGERKVNFALRLQF